MKVQWLGGPDDGVYVDVSDGTREITVAIPNQPVYLVDETVPPTSIMRTYTYPIILTKRGYKILYKVPK